GNPHDPAARMAVTSPASTPERYGARHATGAEPPRVPSPHVKSRLLFTVYDDVTMCCVERSERSLWTFAGVADGLAWRYRAATPAVCGAAIEVPERLAVAVSLVSQSETMPTPGANQSTHLP